MRNFTEKRNYMRTKIISLLISLLLIISAFPFTIWAEAAAPAPEDLPDTVPDGVYMQEPDEEEKEMAEFTSRKYPFYFAKMDISCELPLYFINGEEDLPYINLDDMADVLVDFNHVVIEDRGYSMYVKKNGSEFVMSRESNYSMMVDFEEGTIAFDNYDAFIHSSYYNNSLIDMVSDSLSGANGDPVLIEKLNYGSFDRHGKSMELCLEDYDIHLYYSADEGLYLVPLQTMGDLLVSIPYSFQILFNEEAVYIVNPEILGVDTDELTPIGESLYSAEKKEMSEALAWFNYCELCLVMDYLYGQKDIHDIQSFDRLFIETGLRYYLNSTDTNTADGALRDFIAYYLDESHSGFISPSYRTVRMVAQGNAGFSVTEDPKISNIYKNARNSADHTITTYEESGNTAYITFDSFGYYQQSSLDYYNGNYEVPTDPAQRDLDTIALIIDAHKKITREDSPIENVVLDLSLNSGGMFDAAIFVASWFLGEAYCSMRSSFTGAVSTGTYRCDVNLDGEFDERDTLAGKNLYCIIGPYSFSCANLVPSMLKSSHMVTLLGDTSGGGSCSVAFMSTADGSLFQMSSPNHMSYIKNGSYYDIDQGIEPDVTIVKPENMYNREALTEFINNLF